MAHVTSISASEPPRASKESATEHFEMKERDAADNVHVHNELAYKGDDSDGKVSWTVRHSVAAVSLAMLYAGEL